MIKAAKKALDRRNFLRAIPAVPLAAPSIAAEVARGSMAIQPGIGLGGVSGASTGFDPDWATSRRKALEAATRGEFDDEAEMYLAVDTRIAVAYHYDSLRSLSPTMRAHLHAKHVASVERERRKSWASIELKRFLKDQRLF